jgi:hypothetical protein
MNVQVVEEAIIVGVIMQILYNILTRMGICKGMSVFMTGVIGHIIFEVTGANKWYCKNGSACKGSTCKGCKGCNGSKGCNKKQI